MTRLKKITRRKGVYLEWSTVECNKHNIDALDLTAFSPFQPSMAGTAFSLTSARQSENCSCSTSKYYQAAVFHGVLYFRMRVRRVPASF